MTSNKIDIQRKKRKKIFNQFKLVYSDHLQLEAVDFVPIDDNGTHKIVIMGRPDIVDGDRAIVDNCVYNISGVEKHNGCLFVKCGMDEFETSYRLLQNLGCDVEYGDLVPSGKDEVADRFMDAWVGTMAKNIVSHYSEIINGRDISPFLGMFNHDVPCVCVGAGPSLDKNAHLLHEFPGIIIVADKAYKMIVARGIEPDFVISVDCHYDLVAQMLDYPVKHRHKLILNTCSDPAITREWKGDIYWFLMKHPGVQFMDYVLPALFPKFHGIPNAGNVGNTSVLFADYVGLSPVYLVGQDFGYTDGRMHATRFKFSKDGTPTEIVDDHQKNLEGRTGKISIDGTLTYLPFKHYMENMHNLKNKRGINIVNCTEGGILNGLPKMTLRQAIDGFTPTQIRLGKEAKAKLRQDF